MAYNTNDGNNTLRPRTLYLLYIGPNNSGKSHLIFKLSTKTDISHNEIPINTCT